jgi:hypothetical protein
MTAGAAAIAGTHQSLRSHPQLHSLFKDAENRYLSEPELQHYCDLLPQYAERANAAREVANVEEAVVALTTEEVFSSYAYEEKYGDYADTAKEKCRRDITTVCAYATLAMLMDDAQWFEDKVLIWFKTILHALHLPGRYTTVSPAQKSDEVLEEVLQQAAALPAHIASVYTAYTLLKQHYEEILTEPSWALMKPFLQQTIDVLTEN